jgi:hypothetical protein
VNREKVTTLALSFHAQLKSSRRPESTQTKRLPSSTTSGFTCSLFVRHFAAPGCGIFSTS